ncbi:hypothetical protein [Streptomyces sp. NRRL B-1347]|nr:hypothetical protein [Streptomyces sp. NRRL B-1347]
MPRRPLSRRERLTLLGFVLSGLVSALVAAAADETFRALVS